MIENFTKLTCYTHLVTTKKGNDTYHSTCELFESTLLNSNINKSELMNHRG